MLKDKNHTPVFVPISHKWTDQEKQINCKICLLAENMRDCKSCPFFGEHRPSYGFKIIRK